jgi:hypothetical protein
MLKWTLIGIISIIAIIFIYGIIKNKINRRKQIKIFKGVFTENYFPFPTIEFGFVYSWPTFKIVFKYKSDLERAKKLGLTLKFEKEIQNIYDGDFDSTRAVSYEFKENDTETNTN